MAASPFYPFISFLLSNTLPKPSSLADSKQSSPLFLRLPLAPQSSLNLTSVPQFPKLLEHLSSYCHIQGTFPALYYLNSLQHLYVINHDFYLAIALVSKIPPFLVLIPLLIVHLCYLLC